MPRQARKPSSTGIYHIMLRSINRQQIFEDIEDRGDGSLVTSPCPVCWLHAVASEEAVDLLNYIIESLE